MKTVSINKVKVKIFEENELREKLKLNEEQINLVLTYQREFPELLQDGLQGFVINGETLWEQLSKPQGEFKKWFNRKIHNKFIENTDFVSTDKLVDIGKTNLKRSKIEVKLTIETAKHLAMSTGMDNNSSEEVKNIGRIVRDYFIVMENTLRRYEEWTTIREPEKQGYNDMKQYISKWCDINGFDNTIDKFYTREADMINVSLTGKTAQELKVYIGYNDRITRDHLDTKINKAISELQSLNISLLIANISFDERSKIIKSTCDNRYVDLKLNN